MAKKTIAKKTSDFSKAPVYASKAFDRMQTKAKNTAKKPSGQLVTKTVTNRVTGKKNTTAKALTSTTKKAFISGAKTAGAGKSMAKSTPRSTTTAYKQAQSEKFARKKYER